MEQKSGFAFHCHHDQLVEWVTNYGERVRYIKKHKPKNEVELRLKLFKFIPLDRLPVELIKAGEAYVKAVRKYYPELEKLHSELCHNCPWDGHTIFPKEKAGKS